MIATTAGCGPDAGTGTGAHPSTGRRSGDRVGDRQDTYRVTQARVVRSEWIKMRSLRSTSYTLAAAVVMMIGFGAFLAYLTTAGADLSRPGRQVGFDATATSLGGVSLAQLAIGILGVLLVTGEYSTGLVRASLAAVPRRLPVLWAKLAVFAAVAGVVMVAASLVAFEVGQAILTGDGTETTLSAPGVARAVVGAGLYLAGVGVLGMALGFVLRNTAGAIASLVGAVVILPTLAQLLPPSWSEVGRYLPSNAGQAVVTVHQVTGGLTAWRGFAVFCAYLAAATVAAAVLLKRRDA